MLIGVTEPPGIFFSEKKDSKYEVTNLNWINEKNWNPGNLFPFGKILKFYLLEKKKIAQRGVLGRFFSASYSHSYVIKIICYLRGRSFLFQRVNFFVNKYIQWISYIFCNFGWSCPMLNASFAQLFTVTPGSLSFNPISWKCTHMNLKKRVLICVFHFS
jgi:hypothetical protein